MTLRRPRLPHPTTTATIAREPIAAHPDLRRRWLYILPAVFLTYSLAYLDRANYGFGAAAGLAATLHITGNQAALLAGLFFAGYFAFQIPGAALTRRFSVRSLVSAALIGWGICAALTGILRTFWLLALDRLLLGVAESLILPVMLHLLTRWFTRAERSRANTVLIIGNPATVLWMSIVTGLLIERFGWQRTFVLEGLPSILWGIVWFLFVRDEPTEAKWLSPAAARALEEQLTLEQQSIPKAASLARALLRADVLLLSAQFFSWSLGVYGFVLWLPTIVRQGAGLSMSRTGFLAAVPYVAAIAMMFLVSHLSDRSQRRRALVWPFLLVAGVAMFGSFALAPRSFTLAFVCLIVSAACMYAPYGPFFAMIPERLPRSVSAECTALINSCGALGGFCGSYFVGLLQSLTGNSRAGFLLMSLALIASALMLLVLNDPPPNAEARLA